jgi:ABC-type multidrug transport system permease subunit
VIEQGCHGGPYLKSITYTTTKSYIISFLSSYRYYFIGISLEIVVGMGYGVLGWWYGLVMAGMD